MVLQIGDIIPCLAGDLLFAPALRARLFSLGGPSTRLLLCQATSQSSKHELLAHDERFRIPRLATLYSGENMVVFPRILADF